MPGSILGTQVRRIEDPDLVTGQTTYVGNLRVEGLAHAVFVRSPFAHARVAAVDVSAAAAAPGVIAVLTGQDLDSPAPQFATATDGVPRYPLARDEVYYVGDPVALVVAETRAQAVDAAELVDVDYEELPVLTDCEAALAPDAPLQYPSLGSNLADSRRDPDRTDPFAGEGNSTTHVTKVRIVNQRLATAPMEGHGILVKPEPGGGLTCWVSTQHPHLARDLIAKHTGLDKDAVRVVAPHVGGAFGGKAGATTEHAAIVSAALRTGRPVVWTETRSEAMISMQGRAQVQYAELGLDDDGKFTALRLRLVGDCGAYAGFGGAFPVGSGYLMAKGPYEIPRLHCDAAAAMTNLAPVGAFRGAGRPEAAALLERLVDAAAAETGIAPEELRRRNFVAPQSFPHETGTGATYDNGDYDLALTEALRAAGIDELRAEQARRREAGETRQLGIGIATYVEITGFGGTEFGSVRIGADGGATVMAGTSAHGQGHGTSFAMIVSDRLGIPMDQIRFVQSDTAAVRSGGGTGGSRSLQMAGNAVGQAADGVHAKAVDLAAAELEAATEDIELRDDGTFGVRGVPAGPGAGGIGWAQLARLAAERGLGSDTDFHMDGATFPFGAHVSVVEVDTETGLVTPVRHVAVDDCGRVLNPLLVSGQQQGGALQGISQALWEHMEYDEDGQPVTSTFADYAIPSTADAIALETSNTETPTPKNPLDAKGIGESATVGSTPAVQNAVIDAVRHLGVRHIDMPCTPERVWEAIEAARRGEDANPWREPPAILDELPEREQNTGAAEV